jgi:hypothetical protein
VEVGFTLLQTCLDKPTGCAATDLAALFSRAKDQIEAKGVCEAPFAALGATWPGLNTTLLHGLEVLRPRADATPRSIALASTELVFDLLEHRYCVDGAEAVCLDLKDLREIVKGVLEDRIPAVLVTSSSFLERSLEQVIEDEAAGNQRAALLKIARVAGALTAYASTYASSSKEDPESIKEAHEARKKAIEGLMDATTDRTNRGGQWVASIGVNPGFSVSGAQYVFNTTRLGTSPNTSGLPTSTPTGYMPPQIQLPMGLALQKLPKPKTEGGVGCGGHFQLSVIDLGQFVALDKDTTVSKPRWDSFVMVGIQAGFIIGTPSNPFVIGFDGRWSPTLFSPDTTSSEKVGGALRAGLFASYYVPFFDFN